MVRHLKYDRHKIIEDYQKGLSLHDLERKYGISYGYAYKIVRRAGVNRSISQGVMLCGSNRIEWRKLVRTGWVRKDGKRSTARILSLPGEILIKLGVNPELDLEAKWVVKNKTLQLLVKEH